MFVILEDKRWQHFLRSKIKINYFEIIERNRWKYYFPLKFVFQMSSLKEKG